MVVSDPSKRLRMTLLDPMHPRHHSWFYFCDNLLHLSHLDLVQAIKTRTGCTPATSFRRSQYRYQCYMGLCFSA